jgi:hypothetical protein
MEVSLLFFRVITGVGDCIVAELNATPQSGGVPPGMRLCYPVVGEVAQDNCNCGQLTLTVQQEGNSYTFPQLSNSVQPGVSGCFVGDPVALIQIQLDRCVSGPTNLGQTVVSPSCANMRADALKLYADAEVIKRATACCLAEMKRNRIIRNYTLPQVSYLGPQGNCAAVVGTFWVQ